MSLGKLIQLVEAKQHNPKVKEMAEFRTGDTLKVGVRIKEGEKTRVQFFQGTCIGVKAHGSYQGHFRVRKISDGVGVERVFPFHSPVVESIEVLSKGRSRRSKHYYLRDRVGKSARIAIDYNRE
jgi:large subunit ribosomal protein L19